MKLITSASNQIFKDARRLATKSRSDDHRILIEGTKLIKEALTSGAIAETIFISEGSDLTDFPPGFEKFCISISAKLFRELSSLQTPARSIGIFKLDTKKSLDETLKKPGIIVVIDRIQDPGNLGTIIRTSEAMGANAVLLLDGSCSLYNPKVTRAAMGSSFRLPIFSRLDYKSLAQLLAKNNFDLTATVICGKSLCETDFREKTALFLGQEGSGLSPQILKDCTLTLAIPMQGQVESLNVATSAAICLYEWSRQKNKQTMK